jgi:predicted RNA-binding Zn ribbon-like protein
VNLSIPVTLTKKKSRAASDTEEGLLDLSAVNEGLITIERDGSFKDTEKLTALLNALDAHAAKLRTKLRTEGLDIKLDPTLTTFHDVSMAYHAASLALEACAMMLPLASDAQLSNFVDSIEDQMESSSDYLVTTVREIETLLAA